jgi:CheY-like chemotaxis protein
MKDGVEAVNYFKGRGFSNKVVRSDIEGGCSGYSQVDLVILDLNLPKIDGIGVLKFLKSDSKYCLVPAWTGK